MFKLSFTDSFAIQRDIFCDSFEFFGFDDTGVKAVKIYKPNTMRVYEFIDSIKVDTIFRAKRHNESSIQS